MNNKFEVCVNVRNVQSNKSWWPGYKNLWGHRNHKRECILVSRADFDELLIFASNHPIQKQNKTYQMNISRVKCFFNDYWILSHFALHEKQYCQDC